MSQHVLSALDFFKSWFQGAGGHLKKTEFLEEPKGTTIPVAIRMHSDIASGEIMQPYVSFFAAHFSLDPFSSWSGQACPCLSIWVLTFLVLF